MAAHHVAFVRAVMIGREGVHAPVLVEMFERAGAASVRSHLATGNVSFAADPDAAPEIVAAVEDDLVSLLGRDTPLFVRTLDALHDLIDADPFAAAPFADPIAREVTLLRDRVPDSLTLPIASPRGDWVVFAASDREMFSVQRLVDGRSQSPGGRIERLVDEPVTTRAIGTIVRIATRLT